MKVAPQPPRPEPPPPPPIVTAKLHALSEMRLAAGLLRNLMVKVHNDYVAGGPPSPDARKAIEFVSDRIVAYIKAQERITPYEDPRLATVVLKGDQDNPLRLVQQLDLSKLTDAELAVIEPILLGIQPNPPTETQH